MTLSHKIILSLIVAVVVILTVALVYLQYRPSQQEVLGEFQPPLTYYGTQAAIPLNDLPPADRDRFAERLRSAMQTIEPKRHVVRDRLFTEKSGSTIPIRTVSDEYFARFGYQISTSSTIELDGHEVYATKWVPGNPLRALFDDRTITAVIIQTAGPMVDYPVPHTRTALLGYFVTRPN